MTHIAGNRSLWESTERWLNGQERCERWNWSSGCARLWWRYETANKSWRKWQNHWCEIQDVRLRFGHCIQFVGNRMGQGKDHRRGRQIEEFGYCEGAIVATGEVTLFEWVFFSSVWDAFDCRWGDDQWGSFLNKTFFSLSLVLAEDAIKAALADYKIKQDSAAKKQE